jgi:uncharacterized protein YdcH (DUF465 family)
VVALSEKLKREKITIKDVIRDYEEEEQLNFEYHTMRFFMLVERINKLCERNRDIQKLSEQREDGDIPDKENLRKDRIENKEKMVRLLMDVNFNRKQI